MSPGEPDLPGAGEMGKKWPCEACRLGFHSLDSRELLPGLEVDPGWPTMPVHLGQVADLSVLKLGRPRVTEEAGCPRSYRS